MKKNNNFLKFMGFRKQVLAVTADQAGASGVSGTANTVTLTLADFGDIVTPGTAATDLEVVIEHKAAISAGRGTKYTRDDVTGENFTAAANTAIGEFTRIASADMALHNSSGKLTFTAQSGADGIDLAQTDVVTVISYYGAGDSNDGSTNATGGAGSAAAIANVASTAFTMADGISFPSVNYLGADSITTTKTRLSFKSLSGTAVDDDVLLHHTAGKFKNICRAMEGVINGSAVKRGNVVTITDVFNNTTVKGHDLGITECHITYA